MTLQTFGDGPADMQIPDAEHARIMHVSYPIGTSILMGSDVPSTSGHPVNTGNNFSISYLSGSREETDGLFAKLSEGGNVTMPLTDTFWGHISVPALTSSASTGSSTTINKVRSTAPDKRNGCLWPYRRGAEYYESISLDGSGICAAPFGRQFCKVQSL